MRVTVNEIRRLVQPRAASVRETGPLPAPGKRDHMERPAPRLHPSVGEYVKSARLADTYDEYFADSALFSFDARFIAESLGYPRDPDERFHVLDLGCGTGRHLVQAAANGCLATGVDLNPHMLRRAGENLDKQGIQFSRRPDRPAGVRLLHGDLLDPPLRPGERFDAILMMFSTFGLVHGASNRRRLLLDLGGRLADNGRLILHVHNELRHRRLTRSSPGPRLAETRPRAAKRLEAGDHIQIRYRGEMDLYLHYFTPGEVTAMLSETRFSLRRFLPLNDERDGELPAGMGMERANGFLVAAAVR